MNKILDSQSFFASTVFFNQPRIIISDIKISEGLEILLKVISVLNEHSSVYCTCILGLSTYGSSQYECGPFPC